jgi:hypothetical protein
MYLHYIDKDSHHSIWRVVKGGLVLEGATTIYMPELGWESFMKNAGGGTTEGVVWDAITDDDAQILLAGKRIHQGRMYDFGVVVPPKEPARYIEE